MNVTAAIITIGDELLIGQVVDTNSAWIARNLNKLGIDVLRRVAVGDDRNAIINALNEELQASQLIIMTGGLGPTADDITKPLLNEYFSGKIVVDEAVLEHVKNIFAKRNRPFLERNMKQAEVPDVCTVLFNKMGTAPGMWFEQDGKVIISLPGVPFEMVHIMEQEVLPRLKERFISDALLHRSVVTAGEGESFIAEKIKDIEEALPAHIRLAYLPGAGMVKLRLTGRGADANRLATELKSLQKQIADRLEHIVVAMEDIPLEQVLGRWFSANNATLGMAESCTGGFIAHHITQVQGSSAYFKGCIVCYSNDIKEKVLGVRKETIEQYGAISEQTVTELVKGALKVLDVEYAFAVTGLMSEGGESDKIEVGTVWMAVADKNTVATRKMWFPFDRARNKEMTVSMGMLLLWKFITKS
ncbi:MAG: CinA family nicotinamide mononucleotide deamidase-related protein [Flavipsychrobacter sp.]|jgi:nicotinamide-nucleotide amidase|nr:CinA family nicotinamide mononucleotide deamidase-related protein [Flavipsychrobacter sp.]